MIENLMDTVRSQITSEAVEKASASTGESPENTRRAMNGAVPALFAGLAQSVSARGGAERILGAFGQGGVSGLVGRVTGSSGTESPAAAGDGQGLMSKIFGERTGAVSHALAESSGIKNESATHVLSFVAPLVAGVVGKAISSRRLDAGGLSGLLLGQRKAIAEDAATPRGLAGALGGGPLSEIGGAERERDMEGREGLRERLAEDREHLHERAIDARERMHEGIDHARRKNSRSIWLPALLLGLLAVWGIFALTGGRGPTGVTAPQPTLPQVNAPEIPKAPELGKAPEAPSVPELPKAPEVQSPSTHGAGPITLPGGATLDVGNSGPAADLARSLADSSQSLPQTFQFDALTFETGSATLSGQSEATTSLDQIADMLKAYPDARVRVVGHTDNRGDPATNDALSAARAKTVERMLVDRGIAADRIGTAGKSDSEAVANNDTDEGRGRNRRVDVVLLSR
ncbi:MAG TPA: DUF937 domain-containing protein [Polyangiaceae bacterium]|nr:DUF937 domain-containing protein [Polyangiaceae bacterium]